MILGTHVLDLGASSRMDLAFHNSTQVLPMQQLIHLRQQPHPSSDPSILELVYDLVLLSICGGFVSA